MFNKKKLIVLWLGLAASVCDSVVKETEQFSETNGAFYTEDAVVVNGKKFFVGFLF